MAPLGRRAFLKLAAQITALMAMTIKFPSLTFSTPIPEEKKQYKPTDFYAAELSNNKKPSEDILKAATNAFRRACEHHKAVSIKNLSYQSSWEPEYQAYRHIWSAVLLLPA